MLFSPKRCYSRVVLSIMTLLCLNSITSFAQDPSFSQFYANKTYLNPAFTGVEKGLSLAASSRVQWYAVDRGFRTYDINCSTQIPFARLGIGLHLHKNAEGFANLTTTSAGLSISYTIPGKKNNLHFGFETKISEKTIDWNRLTFSDELDPIFGIISSLPQCP